MPEHIHLNEGRHLFGLNPQGYADARPDYPQWIFEYLRERGALFGKVSRERAPRARSHGQAQNTGLLRLMFDMLLL